MKIPSVFTIIKSKKTKPQNTDFFFFFLYPSAGKWWEVMEVGTIKYNARNQR